MLNTLKSYSVYGIRVNADDESYNIGDTCRYSYEWDYENDCSTYNTDTPIKLPGTCSLHLVIYEDTTNTELINKINEIKNKYAGEQIVIIGGYDYEYGSDDNEIIIEDAEVLLIA
ncbi:MAG TPA: hypothetical protein DEG71_08125 [Clostridiales bacterium]|nr:hypothetical protein [Clostridiales bacterium]